MSLGGGGPLGNNDSMRFEKLRAVIRRRREQRRLRRADVLERKVAARENLRDFKQATGNEPGQWTGGL